MCGITGFCDFSNHSTKNYLVDMTNTLQHRGPDGFGYDFKKNNFATVGLGHRRLSIIDVSSSGSQPMYFNGLAVVFNGEIYNYKEIAQQLIKEGYNFSSNSDTEVVIKAFDKWGIDAVNRFIGMFAIVIYDELKDKITIIRDRAGVKPLYYYFKDGLFLFGSELKAFHKHPNFKKKIHFNSLNQFLKYGYILSPNTIFEDTHKLSQGHYLTLDLKTQKLLIIQYWSVSKLYEKPLLNIDRAEIVLETERILTSAFKYRMVADVPVGVFLSGGYDSSCVAGILQKDMSEKLKTFTIGFEEEKYNEAEYAKNVSQHLGTDHTEYYCTQKEASDIMLTLPFIYDEPFADSSAIPTILVSKLACKQVKVSLSADGGDEIFGGYDKYNRTNYYVQSVNRFPIIAKKIIAKGIELIPSNIFSNITTKTYLEKLRLILLSNQNTEVMKIFSQCFTDLELDLLLINNTNENISCFNNDKFDTEVDDINKLLSVDYETYMVDDILTKIDRATMSVGLEGREPFLDHRIIEFMAQIPGYLKVTPINKSILKEIVHKYLPKSIMERPKKGFAIPLHIWFHDELKFIIDAYLDENIIKRQGIFNVKEIVKLKNNYLNKENVNFNKIWYLLCFQMWYKEWMSNEF